MASKEATARIKINKLLEAAGWRFFPEGSAPPNIRLELGVTIQSFDLDALGENFEKTSKGFVDFLLLDTKSFPLIVLEAKPEDRNPLIGKEQARKYATGPRTAGLSSSLTATCTTSGIWSVATLTSLRPSPSRNR